MLVGCRGASIMMDIEEGMVVVPRHAMKEFDERQEELTYSPGRSSTILGIFCVLAKGWSIVFR